MQDAQEHGRAERSGLQVHISKVAHENQSPAVTAGCTGGTPATLVGHHDLHVTVVPLRLNTDHRKPMTGRVGMLNDVAERLIHSQGETLDHPVRSIDRAKPYLEASPKPTHLERCGYRQHVPEHTTKSFFPQLRRRGPIRNRAQRPTGALRRPGPLHSKITHTLTTRLILDFPPMFPRAAPRRTVPHRSGLPPTDNRRPTKRHPEHLRGCRRGRQTRCIKTVRNGINRGTN